MKLVIEIPETARINQEEATKILAAKLYEMGVLSSGQSAMMAGCTKRAFIEELGSYNVSLFNFENPDIELSNDISNARNYHI